MSDAGAVSRRRLFAYTGAVGAGGLVAGGAAGHGLAAPSAALSTFIRHEASALFAIPPGCAEGGYLGQGLLESA